MIRINRVIKGILVFTLCLVLAGCGSQWKRKFVRKKTDNKPEQIFTYEPQKYEREANDVLYKRHFVFWKSWQDELAKELGRNKKSDILAFDEALKNLDEMKACLKEEKAAELDIYINKTRKLYDIYNTKELDIVRFSQMRDDINRLMLKIDKLFRYSRVKDYIL
ncbi:MAG: hypothetical protein PHO42_06300 [Candidatus Omnitrophica bacterium]|nr:hypothetical protein [Candidatus Omnitrophota bacterium]